MKTLLKILLGLVAIVAVLVIGLAFFIDTNQYKAALESAVASNSGYELTIAGDLELNLFPTMGLTLNDVRLKNAASNQELASTSAISLRVDRGSLINGEIRIEEFSTDDFHINYLIDETGKSAWEVDAPVSETVGTESASEGSSVSASFDRIAISNASIDYQDVSQGTQYSLSNVNLESNGANFDGRPFGLNLAYDFVTHSTETGLVEPIPMSLRTILSANLESGSIEISEFNFTLTPLLLQGQVAISNLNDSPQISGSLRADQVDVLGLMQTVSGTQDTTSFSTSGPAPRLSLAMNFSANDTQLAFSEITGTLDDTVIEGDMNVRLATDFTPINISYNLASSAVDLTPFLASEEPATPAGDAESATTPAEDTPLPIEMLSNFDVLGSIAIESIKANDFLFEDITILTNIESSVLDIEIQPITAFGGNIDGNVRIDGRSTDAPMTMQLNVSQLNIVDLAPSVSRLNSVTGKLNIVSDHTANASSVNRITDTINGSTQFAITENSADIGVIKQIFTTISALSPSGGSIAQWPDVIQFSEMAGYIVLSDGIDENQQINLKMDNLILDGIGGLDLAQGSFNYLMAFTIMGEPELQTIPIDPLYHGVEWPVICSAEFSADVSQYCRPDFTRVREIFTQIGTNAVRGQLQDAITDQVPEDLKETARGLLRGILN